VAQARSVQPEGNAQQQQEKGCCRPQHQQEDVLRARHQLQRDARVLQIQQQATSSWSWQLVLTRQTHHARPHHCHLHQHQHQQQQQQLPVMCPQTQQHNQHSRLPVSHWLQQQQQLLRPYTQQLLHQHFSSLQAIRHNSSSSSSSSKRGSPPRPSGGPPQPPSPSGPPRLRRNKQITAPELMVVFPDGSKQLLGLSAALSAAAELQLDLVEVNGRTTPPVAR